ncbi:MAG: hypothetical protein AAGF85_00540 [Bacteroidota bacterium]
MSELRIMNDEIDLFGHGLKLEASSVQLDAFSLKLEALITALYQYPHWESHASDELNEFLKSHEKNN